MTSSNVLLFPGRAHTRHWPSNREVIQILKSPACLGLRQVLERTLVITEIFLRFSNLSKIFTGIINKRVVLWSEPKGFFVECQVGFCQKKITVDQMFILKTIIDKFFRKRGRFYCMFVDFSKAFDTVNINYLFYSLTKSGMHGKMLQLIRKVYSNVKGTVCIDEVTDFFRM